MFTLDASSLAYTRSRDTSRTSRNMGSFNNKSSIISVLRTPLLS